MGKKDRGIKVEIKGERESALNFVKVWHAARVGKKLREPVERLYFPDLTTLLQHLTPRRLAALRTLHDSGAVSVRALSKALRRDYKNVHRDVQTLERIGLVTRTKEGLICMPWESVVAEIPLAA